MKRLLLLATLVLPTQGQQTWMVQKSGTSWNVSSGATSVSLNGKRMFTLADGTIVPDGSLYVTLAGNPTTGEWFSLTENGWDAMTANKASWPTTAIAYRWSNPNTGIIDLKRGATTPKLASGTQLYLGVFAVPDMSKAKPGQIGIFTAPSWKTNAAGTAVLMDLSDPSISALRGSVDGGSLRVANPTVVTPTSKVPSLSIVFTSGTPSPNGTRTFAVQSSNLNVFSGYELQYSFNLEKWFSARGYTGFNSSMSWSLTGNAKSMFFRLAK